MIKGSDLEFHETFQPETVYLSKILKLAHAGFVGTKFEISDISGIPTGKQKGKVEPHIKYAAYMGLINYSNVKGIYKLSLTKLGEEVYLQDPYLYEELSCWLCHYGISKRNGGAPQWIYLIQDFHPGFNNIISQERLFTLAGSWCDVPQTSMSRKVFSVVKNSYMEGFFEQIKFLEWNDTIKFLEHLEKPELIYVYAYALLDSWEQMYPTKQEISELDLKNGIGFNKIFGFNEDECNLVIDLLVDEGIISVNRQLYPMTLIRTASLDNMIPYLYSRLL